MRVVIDTNVWVSYLISKRLDKLSFLIHDETIKILYSNKLETEFLATTSREKLRKYFSIEDVKITLTLLHLIGELVHVTSDIQLCRDPKDDYLLNLSVDGQADFLITGDKDLLALETIKKTRILTFTDFINKTETNE